MGKTHWKAEKEKDCEGGGGVRLEDVAGLVGCTGYLEYD